MHHRYVRHVSGYARPAGSFRSRLILVGGLLLAASLDGIVVAAACDPHATACTSAPEGKSAASMNSPGVDSAPIAVEGELPQLRFDQASVDFGTVDTDSSGAGVTLTLFNDSSTVSATGLQIVSDPAFPWIPRVGSNCEGVVFPRSSCSVRIKFAPTAQGPISGTLTATSAQGAAAQVALTGVGGDDFLLYSQRHDESTLGAMWGVLATHYSISTTRSSDAAEDFVVATPGWTIHSVGFEVFSERTSSSVPPTEAIFFADDNGLPGAVEVCSTSVSSTTWWETAGESRAEIALSPPCDLTAGHYWLQVKFHLDVHPGFSWGTQYVRKKEDLQPVRWNPPLWRQPGGGNGYPGCFDWTALVPANCGSEEQLPWQMYGMVFWLSGQHYEPIFADGFDE
jgi:hypothetical protein